MIDPPSPHILIIPNFTLKGEVPSSIAAVAQLAAADGRWIALAVHKQGLTAHILARGQRVVHAEARSAEGLIEPVGLGRLRWEGINATRALALLANEVVQIEIRGVADPGPRHVPNLDTSLSMVLLEMAIAVDTKMGLGSLPCVFEPVAMRPQLET